MDREKWADGMRPRPDGVGGAAAEWEPGEVYWIVKHGIKMTGMPAFGPSHDEETLRGIVAFVKELPAMTPERYAALGGDSSEGRHQGASSNASSGVAGPSAAGASGVESESGNAGRQGE